MRRVPTGPTDPQNEDPASRDQQARRQGLAYQGAFEAVMAIPIAIGGGYWLDRHFDKSPTFLILGAVLGFSAFVVRLLRLGRQLEMRREPGRDGNQP
ncbi:MAG TPA: AtpZ/AtpI family protein [Myxococcota bacterium]|nr:AtpZ/AtpI family protein [Myxococcota bacterium]